MARTSKRQQEEKSCGAATLLVALHELTGTPAKTTNKEEAILYTAIKCPGIDVSPGVKVGADETFPSSIYEHVKGEGLNAEIIESSSTVGAFGAKQMYQGYRLALGSASLAPSTRDVSDSDLNNDARLFLVMKFVGSDLTHYVLARKDGGLVYIMNPDPGSDDQRPLPAFNARLDTNQRGTWAYDSTAKQTTLDGRLRNYEYTGIAIRVWK